jgi:hypothetical protein
MGVALLGFNRLRKNSVSGEILALSGFYETAGFVNWFLVFS